MATVDEVPVDAQTSVTLANFVNIGHVVQTGRTYRCGVGSTLVTVGDKARNLNRFAADHLWDDTGREWQRVASNLGRDEVENALLDPAIRVGLHDDFGQPIQWIADTSKKAVWVDQIESHFADRGQRSARSRPRSREPFCASLWESNGQRLLIFDRD